MKNFKIANVRIVISVKVMTKLEKIVIDIQSFSSPVEAKDSVKGLGINPKRLALCSGCRLSVSADIVCLQGTQYFSLRTWLPLDRHVGFLGTLMVEMWHRCMTLLITLMSLASPFTFTLRTRQTVCLEEQRV